MKSNRYLGKHVLSKKSEVLKGISEKYKKKRQA